jgi:rhodanese-related sulfurtransferase
MVVVLSSNGHSQPHLVPNNPPSPPQPDTVVIDVRNAYESAIGHFQPPEGGATLLDPKMRNSREFPKWIHEEVRGSLWVWGMLGLHS